MPLAIVVVANGRLCRSTTWRSRSGSATRIADEPSTAIGRLAFAISSAALAIMSAVGGRTFDSAFIAARVALGGRERHVLRQVEMHRPARLAHGDADRLLHRLGDLALLQPERRLGDRREQRVMVDPHLDAPAELLGDEVAGDGDHRRAVEPGVADAGREIGRARTERGDAKPRRPGHAAGDVGGEARRAFVRGQHEIHAALSHRLHQRQHVAARDAEAAVDAGGLQSGDDQVGIVHGVSALLLVCSPVSHGCPEMLKGGAGLRRPWHLHSGTGIR